MRAMATAMRIGGNIEGEGGMAMTTMKRVVGKQWQRQQRGQWQLQQGWQVRMRAMARVARAMAMATKRVVARKRAMVSNDNNKTMATETTTMTMMTTAIIQQQQ